MDSMPEICGVQASSCVIISAIDYAPIAFFLFNQNDRLSRSNKAGERILERLREESPMDTLDDFFDYVFNHKIKLLKQNETGKSEEKDCNCGYHDFQEVIEVKNCAFLMQAMVFKTGETGIYLTDISEIRSKDQQLFQAQKLEALGLLAGGIAHDFNNVLSIIDGYARMAESGLNTKQKPLADHLQRIRQAVDRGASLTRQLLLFGRHKIDKRQIVDIAWLLRDQKRFLGPLLDSSIKLNVQSEKGLYVSCIPDGLTQIIMNLVINARDAMPEGGRINITAQKNTEGMITLTVSDTGTGIEPEVIEKIFDPFFTTKGSGHGTGLGLSMIYGIVQEMEGKIEIDSILGQGTNVHINLPLCHDENVVKKIRTTESNDYGVRFDGYTALVAEDESDILCIMSGFLESLGIEVIQAENGAEALVKQDEYEGDIDFLLTDVVMPELNGVKLSELMQAVRDECKVIFMSGFAADNDLSSIQIPEQATLLYKPVSFEKLVQTMCNILDDGNVDDELIGERKDVFEQVKF